MSSFERSMNFWLLLIFLSVISPCSRHIGACPKEPREQRVQCQACLSIAESRPRVDEVNFPLPTQAVQPYMQHRLPKPPALGLILYLTSYNTHPSYPSSYALSMFDFAKLSPCICQNILLQLTIRSIRNCHFGTSDVGCLAFQVLAIGNASHGLVLQRTAVAAVHHDGLAETLSGRVKHVFPDEITPSITIGILVLHL